MKLFMLVKNYKKFQLLYDSILNTVIVWRLEITHLYSFVKLFNYDVMIPVQ